MISPLINAIIETCTMYYHITSLNQIGRAVVVVIVWWLDSRLPMQSVPITTNIVSRILLRQGLHDTT